MNFLKWLRAVAKASVISLGLVGCVSALTTPVTGFPLFIITLIILFIAPPSGHRLRSWWEGLTIVLLAQMALFNLMMLIAWNGQIGQTRRRWRQRPFDTTFWSSTKVQQGGMYFLLSLLPTLFLAAMLYLWWYGWQTLALWLMLPFTLLLAIVLVSIFMGKKVTTEETGVL